MAKKKKIKKALVLGLGPVGCCWVGLFASRGIYVEAYEIQSEASCVETHERSVNLALGVKGWEMFTALGCTEEVKQIVVPMHGRIIHDRFSAATTSQAYGRIGQHLDSINRSTLNQLLITHARTKGAKLTFGIGCKEVLENDHIVLTNNKIINPLDYDFVIAADGVGSPVRESLKKLGRIEGERKFLNYGYKEIEFPAVNGNYSMDKNGLHIWPKKSCMVIALPNPDYTFTGGVFAPLTGFDSFEEIERDNGASTFFNQNFISALSKVPNFIEQYSKPSKRVSKLSEVRCKNWFYKNIIIAGDAAHGVTPFYGQGMNFGMFCCLRFMEYLDAYGLLEAIKKYQELKLDADLLADWSLENFHDMSGTGDIKLQTRKAIEAALEEKYPNFNGPHSMVCFTTMRYSKIAKEIQRQDEAFEKILEIENIETNWKDEANWQEICHRLAA